MVIYGLGLLCEQEELMQAKSQYAIGGCSYIMKFATLKNASGTLSLQDVQFLNSWVMG